MFLRGRVKFPIGSDRAILSLRATISCAGSSAILGPTVIVWMGEGVVAFFKNSFKKAY